MLIVDRVQQDQLHIVRRLTCASCREDLDYPRIVLLDSNAASYHINCALEVNAVINADILELLTSPELAEFVKPLAFRNFRQKAAKEWKQRQTANTRQPEELSAIAQAFRKAAHHDIEPHV